MAHVLVHGDSSASMRLIRALRYYDDTGRPLAPTRQMRMLDDHPGVLAVLPTSGTFSVRLEIE